MAVALKHNLYFRYLLTCPLSYNQIQVLQEIGSWSQNLLIEAASSFSFKSNSIETYA